MRKKPLEKSRPSSKKSEQVIESESSSNNLLAMTNASADTVNMKVSFSTLQQSVDNIMRALQ